MNFFQMSHKFLSGGFIFYGKPADEGGYKTVAEKIKEELLILAVYDTV